MTEEGKLLLPRLRTVVPNVSDEDIIRLTGFILSAVESGKLRLPGEVGRGDFHMKTRQDIESWVDDMLEKDASVFIALRPAEEK